MYLTDKNIVVIYTDVLRKYNNLQKLIAAVSR